MTVALVVGAGEIGTRAVRQLLDTSGFATVLLADRDLSRSQAAADALGRSVHAIEYTPGDPIPPDVEVIACALPAGVGHDAVAAAISAGVPVASSDDEHDALEQLRALDQNARSSGVTVAIGCGLAPGLTDVLAVHAAALFENVDEIRVARTGTRRSCRTVSTLAGPAHPVRATRISSTFSNRAAACTASTSANPGARPHPIATVTPDERAF